MHVLTAVLLSTCALGGAPAGELLDFTAKWCGPCQQMGPIVDRLHRQGYPVRKVDIDQNQELARKYNITSIPAFVLIVDGKVVERSVGSQSEQRLLQMLAKIPKPKPEFDKRRPDEVLLVSSGQKPPAAGMGPNWKPALPAVGKGLSLPFLPRKTPAQTAMAQNSVADQSKIRGNNENDDRSASLDAIRAREPMQASIRIRITDSGGTNLGSGTVIDSKVGYTLILTCGHIFRNFQQDSTVEVDIFTNGQKETLVGKHVRHDLNMDLGLISISTDNPIPFAPVAAEGYRVAKGAGVQSVGCGQGNDPTLQRHSVTQTDRYEGPSNIIECTGVPVQGRSGGGLFNKDGEVIGVCMAADERGSRGLYVGLQAIRGFLNSNGQPAGQPEESSPEFDDPDAAMFADVESEQPAPRGIAALQAALGDDSEGVICVVKSRKNSLAGQKVVVLSNKSPADSVATLKRSLQTGRIQTTSIQK